MKYCIIRKVAYRLPGTSRIVWANVLCECEGLALLFVPKPDANWSHFIVIAQEDVSERVFESVSPHRFDLEIDDLREIGERLRNLGKSLWAAEFRKNFNPEDFP